MFLVVSIFLKNMEKLSNWPDDDSKEKRVIFDNMIQEFVDKKHPLVNFLK